MHKDIIHQEEWKAIKGTKGKYFASNMGRVKSTRKILAPMKDDRGKGGSSFRVSVKIDGRFCCICVQNIVAETFIGAKAEGMAVAHIDKNKGNNRADNLKYAKKYIAKLIDYPKYQEGELHKIINLFNAGVSIKEISKRFGIKESAIWNIRNGKSWAEITGIKYKNIIRENYKEDAIIKNYNEPYMKEIPGTAGKYLASTSGGIFTICHSKEKIKPLKLNQISKFKQLSNHKNFSYYASLCINNKRIVKSAQRLVWTTFIGEIPPGKKITHKNCDKSDNSLCNLQCVSTYIAHFAIGSNKKLSSQHVTKIKHMLSQGVKMRTISQKFKIHEGTISAIASRKSWPFT